MSDCRAKSDALWAKATALRVAAEAARRVAAEVTAIGAETALEAGMARSAENARAEATRAEALKAADADADAATTADADATATKERNAMTKQDRREANYRQLVAMLKERAKARAAWEEGRDHLVHLTGMWRSAGVAQARLDLTARAKLYDAADEKITTFIDRLEESVTAGETLCPHHQ